jgi:hypothetical protein
MFWDNIFGSKLPSVDFCEKAISGIIARPEYFISNLSYIIVGIYLLTRKDKFGKVLGIISLIVGSFSAIYDASYRFNAQLLDLSAMFLLINFLVIYNLYKLKVTSIRNLFILGISLQVIYFIGISLLEGQSGRILFGLGVLSILFTEYLFWKRKVILNYKVFISAFLLFILGFLIWLLDSNKILCSPSIPLNGRTVFHILTAISIYLLYKYNSRKRNILTSLVKTL